MKYNLKIRKKVTEMAGDIKYLTKLYTQKHIHYKHTHNITLVSIADLQRRPPGKTTLQLTIHHECAYSNLNVNFRLTDIIHLSM